MTASAICTAKKGPILFRRNFYSCSNILLTAGYLRELPESRPSDLIISRISTLNAAKYLLHFDISFKNLFLNIINTSRTNDLLTTMTVKGSVSFVDGISCVHTV